METIFIQVVIIFSWFCKHFFVNENAFTGRLSRTKIGLHF